MTKPPAIGERIRKLRLARGLTQAELGKRIGVSQRLVAYYEGRGVSPAPELLLKMARALQTSIEDLVARAAGGRRPAEIVREGATARVHLWRRLKKLESLPVQDRKSVLKMIDALAEQAARRKAS
jgi:transcriptional regulator with XRE-family HTH domain